MGSYRDKYNPEALHFPGAGAAKSFLACTILVAALLIIWAAFTGSLVDRTVNVSLALVVIAVSIAAWPKSILLDQEGLTQHGLTGKRMLAWKEIGSIELTSEFHLPQRSGRFPTQTLIAGSIDGNVRVHHTPRHTDFHRFTFELQRHGVKLPEELGHITAPNLSRLTSAKEPMPEGLRRREP